MLVNADSLANVQNSKIQFWFKAVSVFSILSLCACNAGQNSDASMGTKSLATRAGFITTTKQPKDFVVKTRPQSEYTYPEVTPTPADRAIARRSPEELKALEGQLDAARNRSANFAKRATPKSTYGGIAEARRAALGARTRANRPIYNPANPQPTSYPVPESRRAGGSRAKMSSPLAIPKE
jgi:hypothetical protein